LRARAPQVLEFSRESLERALAQCPCPRFQEHMNVLTPRPKQRQTAV
jgi:hypothetical protein